METTIVQIELSKEEVVRLICGQTDSNKASLWLNSNGGAELLWDMQVGNLSGASKICNVRDLSSSDYSDDFEIEDDENYDETFEFMMDDYKSDLDANLKSEYLDENTWGGEDTLYKIEWTK